MGSKLAISTFDSMPSKALRYFAACALPLFRPAINAPPTKANSRRVRSPLLATHLPPDQRFHTSHQHGSARQSSYRRNACGLGATSFGFLMHRMIAQIEQPSRGDAEGVGDPLRAQMRTSD